MKLKVIESASKKWFRFRAVGFGGFFGLALATVLAIGTPAPYLLGDTILRPACADVVVHQLVSEKAVSGSLNCLGGNLALAAKDSGITNDQQFADAAGVNGTYFFRGVTSDGVYVYELDVNGTGYVVKIYVAYDKVYKYRGI